MKNLGAALLVVVVAVGSFLAGRSMESERTQPASQPDVARPPAEPALELQQPLRQADIEKILASVKNQQQQLEHAAGGSLPPPAASVDTTKSQRS